MADSKITGLAELAATPANTDLLVIVDVSDTTMAGSGTNKKIKANRFLTTNGTASTLGADLNVNSYDINNAGTVGAGTVTTLALNAGTLLANLNANNYNITGVAGLTTNTLTTSGSVGFGTATPGFNAHIVGNSNDGVAIAIQNNSAGATRYILQSTGSSAAPGAGYLEITSLGQPASNRLSFDGSTGRLGIGISNPAYKLDVAGTVRASHLTASSISIGTATTGQIFQVEGSLGGVSIDGNGNTMAFSRPSVNYLRASETGGAFAVVTNGLAQTGANSSIFCSSTSQRVGVAGNSNPSYELDVNGQCHASSFPTSSDMRLKTNINRLNLTSNLKQKLNAINAYTFEWSDNYSGVDKFKRGDGITKNLQVGFIAQEVQAAIPQLVTTWRHVGKDGEVIEDALAVDYTRFVPIMWEGVKELYSEITALKQRVSQLEALVGA